MPAVSAWGKPPQEPEHRAGPELSRLLAADRQWQNGIFAQLAAAKDTKTPAQLRVQSTPRILLAQYTEAHRALDLQKYPREFQKAYLEHLQAWEKLQWELQKGKSADGGLEILLGLGALAAGAPALMALPTVGDGLSKSDQASREKQRAENAANAGVIESWHKLEQVALDCGAQVTGAIPRGYLGVQLDPLTRKLEEPPNKIGILVRSVEPGTPAAKAGLEAGDVITDFDEQPALNFHHLRWRIALARHGTKATIGFVRNGYEVHRTATLSVPPDQQPR